jgi:hypothetical protein
MSGTRSVVSFGNALAHAAGSEGLGFLHQGPRLAHPFATLLSPFPKYLAALRRPMDGAIGTRCVDIAWEPSSLDPLVAPRKSRDLRGSTNQRCVRSTSAQSSNPVGHPDPFGFRVPARCRGEPVRTAFHDAVARFGGRHGLLDRAFSSHRAFRRQAATSDVPVAPRGSPCPPEGERGDTSLRRDRLTPHLVKDASLPRPETPSPFASHQSLGGSWVMQHDT